MENLGIQINYIEEIDVQKDIIEETNKVFGLEKCKEKLINYNTYTKIKDKLHIGNCNVWIKNKSKYNTAHKLVEIIWNILKKNGIIKTKYKYLDIDVSLEETYIQEDLVIVELDSMWSVKEKFKKLLNKYPDKIFIVIQNESGSDENEVIEEIVWRMEIEPISQNDKINYIKKTLKEQNIRLEEDNTFLEDMSSKPYSEIKSDLLNIIVRCKEKNIKMINKNVMKEELCMIYIKKNEKEKKENNKDSIKKLEKLIGLEEVKAQINQIINYINVNKTRGKMPMLHMCFLGNPGSGKTEVARMVRQDICRK